MANMTPQESLKSQLDFVLFDAQPATAPDMCLSGVSPSKPSDNAGNNHNSHMERHIAEESSPSFMLTPMPIMESSIDDTAILVQRAGRDIDSCAHEFLSDMRIRQHSLLTSPDSPLLLEHPLSAPSSIALTTLTSPSLSSESPIFTSSCQVSPHFDDIDYNASEWFSLFPVETMDSMHLDRIASTAVEEAGLNADHLGQPTRDGPLTAPFEQAHRRSSTNGVNRRRTRPLPPIIVEDHNDHVAMKRARNTIAARKSRQRKAQRVEDLENEILRLTAERDHWRRLAETRAS